MIEELAVGAQFKLPYLHMVVNNSYLGLIRQAQRGFDMDYCVQLAFDNINMPDGAARARLRRRPREGGGRPGLQGDPRAPARRTGARASRQAEAWMKEFRCRWWSR
jgi:tartronate-semialdehyde synthase